MNTNADLDTNTDINTNTDTNLDTNTNTKEKGIEVPTTFIGRQIWTMATLATNVSNSVFRLAPPREGSRNRDTNTDICKYR